MNQKDSLNNAKGRLMHFLGFQAASFAPCDKGMV